VSEAARERSREAGEARIPSASWLAWSLCAAAFSLLALALLLILLGWSTPLPKGWVSWQAQAIYAVGLIGAPVLGGLVASRRPENPYGWLWLGLSLGLALLLFGQVYAAYSVVVEPGSLPAPQTVGHVVAGVGWVAAFTMLPLLLLLFPTGRLPSRRWRIVAWAVAVSGATGILLYPFRPAEDVMVPVANPLGVEGPVGEVLSIFLTVLYLIIVFAAVPCALSLVFRYRRAGGVERQQLKWFAYTAVLFVGTNVSQFFYEPPYTWDALVEVVTIVGLYVAVGIAIFKYRLYDIDRIINRTLVYASLTAILVGLYFGGVTATQALFRTLTGQEKLPQLVVVASTLVIAALFNPLRRRIQSFIDRSFYRRKYDAAKTLEGFSMKLRDETDLNALSDDLVGVVRQTMQPAHVSLWLRPETASKGEQAE
jgi:hypothetical protein